MHESPGTVVAPTADTVDTVDTVDAPNVLPLPVTHTTPTAPSPCSYELLPPLSDVVYHPEIAARMRTYAARGELMHTCFYGPIGSGKMTLVRLLIAAHMGVPVSTVMRTKQHMYAQKDREFPFYKTTVHFELNVADFSPNHHRTMMVLLQELAKTLNVSRNCHKLVVVRNAELLDRPVQHQLRRMMELFYSTCRLLFVSHSLDRLDVTLHSRFVAVRVPFPACLVGTSMSEHVPEDASAPQVSTATWLSHQMEVRGLPNIQTSIVDSLWGTLQRKTFPVMALRKWVRIATMTHLSFPDMVYELCDRFTQRYAKHPVLLQRMHETVNGCMHLYAVGYRKEFQPELLLCNLYLLTQAAKAGDWEVGATASTTASVVRDVV